MISKKLFGLGAALVLSVTSGLAQTPAFPGALGHGAYVTGGRSGTVYHVTNTNDSGAGSFRDAVNGSGRIIVFDVGGTINLLTAVSAKGNLTIAGQTAPGGIKFDGGEISFSSRSNIICRYLRIRPGSDTANSTDDAIAFADGRTMIFDHCSIAFAPWNNVGAVSTAWQTKPVTEITFQHCINANPTGQQFGAHTESVSSDWTWCYNIFANSHNRNPLAKVNNVFINNALYNCSAGYTTHTSTKFKHDLVNNYFVAGPGSSGNFPWYQVDNNQSMYFTGNLYDSDKNGALGGSTTAPLPGYQGGGTILSSPWSAWTSIIPTMTPALAWRYDLSAAGAFPRDEVDALVVSQMKTLGSGSTGTGAGTAGPGGGFYTSQTQTGLGNNGYGTIIPLAAPTDTDNDAMPDYWELANSSATNSANSQAITATGYSLLENYLNWLAAPHGVTRTNTAVDLNLSQFVSGFSASATFSLTNATNGTVSLLNATNAHFTPTANFSGLGGFNFIVTEGSYSLNVAVTVCITPVAPPASAVAFNGAIIGVSVATVAVPLPANLIWRGDGSVNAWNTTTSNWLNGATAAAYKNGDVVTFDNTGSNSPAITLSSALTPGSMLFDIDKDYTLTGSGSFSGSSSFSKTGTGNLTVGILNSGFTGPVNIGGGTVSLTSSASLGSGALTLSDGGTLSLPNPAAALIAGSITVPAGENVTITSSHVSNGGYGNLISGDTNSVLNLVGNQSLGGATSSQFSGFNGTIKIVSGNVRFSTASGNNTFGSLNPNFIINGTLQPRNSSNTIVLGALNGSGSLAGPQTAPAGAGSTVFNIGGKNLDAVFNGTIVSNVNSAGSLICLNKLGTGIQTLNGNNTFGGTNGILAGTLLLNGTNLPSLATVFTNATLGGTGTVIGAVSVNNGGKFSPGMNGPGTFTINGNLTLNSPILNFDLSSSPGGANDRINLTGTLGLVNTQLFNFRLTDGTLGAGTYNLIEGANNSTASGVTLASTLPPLTRQTFSLARPSAGSNPSYIRLTVGGIASALVWSGANGNVWDITATTNWLNSGNPDAFYNLDSVIFDDSGANPSLALATNIYPANIVVNAAQNYTFGGTGALIGSGTLTKLGSGTLSIATTNSGYTGNIFIGGGTLALSSGTSIGNGAVTISNSATLALPNSGSSVFIGGAVTVPASQTANITSGVISSGFSGNLSSGNTNSVLNLYGSVSFSGTTSAQFDNFTGTINLQPGATLRYSADTTGKTFGSLAPTLVINGTLQPRDAGNTVLLGGFSGSGTIAGPSSNAGSGDTLYVIGGNNSDANFSGNIASNNAVAGSEVSVTKTGSGKLTLSGASTFTGGTTVESGTLRVNNSTGSGTGSGDLEIFAGATLTGSGIIGSATTIDADAILAPGDPTGTLSFSNNLTLNDSSILKFTLGTTSDRVLVGGSLFLTGQLQVTNAAGFGIGTYTLFTSSSTLTFDNLTLASAPAGFNYSFNTNTAGSVKLVVAPTTPPTFGNLNLSGNSLTLAGSNGIPLGNYYVQSSSNLLNWKYIATNQFDANGAFNFTTNAPPGAQQNFFRLQLP